MAHNLFNPTLNPKLKAMNLNSLEESMNRDINYALNNKPSLDGLSSIVQTEVEKPFMDMENLKLDISNNLEGRNNLNEIVSGQIGDLKNQVLQSNTVAQMVQNNNGEIQGQIQKIEVNSNDGKNFNIKQEVQNLAPNKPQGEEKVIRSFTINLDDMENSGDWVDSSPEVSPNQIQNEKPKLNNQKIRDVPVLEVEEQNKLEKSFNDIMNNVHSNKILTFGFLILVIVLIYLIRNKKIFRK